MSSHLISLGVSLRYAVAVFTIMACAPAQCHKRLVRRILRRGVELLLLMIYTLHQLDAGTKCNAEILRHQQYYLGTRPGLSSTDLQNLSKSLSLRAPVEGGASYGSVPFPPMKTPQKTKYPIFQGSGSKNHTLNGFRNQGPEILGTGTL